MINLQHRFGSCCKRVCLQCSPAGCTTKMEKRMQLSKCIQISPMLGLCLVAVVSISVYASFDSFTPAVQSIATQFKSVTLVLANNLIGGGDDDGCSLPSPALTGCREVQNRTCEKESSIKLHNVTGGSKKQGKEFGYLKPYDHLVVPNIAHFVWFSCRPFKFENLISMLSAHRIMKADTIYFHTDCEPTNCWWDEAKLLIPTLKVIKRPRPLQVFNKELSKEWLEHSADVARLQVLLEKGGVYLDLDVFILAPLEPLRYYEFVVGRQSEIILNNCIIFANKSSKFLQLYYESYKTYDIKCWDCTSVKGLHSLAQEYEEFIHIEPDSLVKPFPEEWKYLFLNNYKYNWRDEHFTIHMWFRMFHIHNHGAKPLNRENIKHLNSTIGEMCRYIYYGQADFVD